MKEVYINVKVQFWIDKLIDLFCLEDDPPVVEIKPSWFTQKGLYLYKKHKIQIGCKNGISLKTLVHEFLHATGYSHEWEFNGWANFRSNGRLDNFSPLIVKDLTGKKELIL